MKTTTGNDINRAAAAIDAGLIVGYPTEGVYGLGCNPCNESAVQQLLQLKQRAFDKGLILIASSRAQLSPFVASVSSSIESKLDADWPGPVTWVLPCSDTTPSILTGGRSTIAARVTSHAPVVSLCEACDSALVSTSANLSGGQACTTRDCVADLFGDKLAYILDLPTGGLRGPTPIFDGISGKQLR